MALAETLGLGCAVAQEITSIVAVAVVNVFVQLEIARAVVRLNRT